ncbi:hypothetical protein BpHYR1_001420 [Brachionus plicatilis]|uniref:Uncharacterized protein n=1 Tax=Brachionus plicatilis TaxID=10195 RepID=A0A3M7RW47_BRAPC|nr:hypothetical protein BpHYR1_001420 [Brachionus plicatilis]
MVNLFLFFIFVSSIQKLKFKNETQILNSKYKCPFHLIDLYRLGRDLVSLPLLASYCFRQGVFLFAERAFCDHWSGKLVEN